MGYLLQERPWSRLPPLLHRLIVHGRGFRRRRRPEGPIRPDKAAIHGRELRARGFRRACTSWSAFARCVWMARPPCRQGLLVFFEFLGVHVEHAVIATAVAAVARQGLFGRARAWVGVVHAADERTSLVAGSRDSEVVATRGRMRARFCGNASTVMHRDGVLAAAASAPRLSWPDAVPGAANHSAVMLACRLYLRSFSTRVVRRMPSSLAACATTPLDAVNACRINPTSMSAR